MFVLFLAFLPLVAAQSSSCEGYFTNSQVGLIIFGSVAGTLAVCTAIGLLMWFLFRSKKHASSLRFDKVSPVEELHVYENPEFRDENGRPADTKQQGQPSVRHGHLPNAEAGRKRRSTAGQIFEKLRSKKSAAEMAQSTESLGPISEQITVPLKSRDLNGLGFTIHGNMRDGIFVKEVKPCGPAIESGKIKTGDRIMNVTINFEKIVFEDAFTILNYAAPYFVVVELQRGEATQKPVYQQLPSHVHGSERRPRIHPLFRSQSVAEFPREPEEAEREVAQRSVSLATAPPQDLEEHPKAKHLESISESKESSPQLSKQSVTKVTTKAQISPPIRDLVSPEPEPQVPKRVKKPKEETDPYADLTAEEKMQILRLSYEDMSVSQSTPNIFAAVDLQAAGEIETEVEGKEHPKLSKTAKVDHSDSDSLPDIESAKQELELSKRKLETPEIPEEVELKDLQPQSPPELTSEMKFETFEVVGNGSVAHSEPVRVTKGIPKQVTLPEERVKPPQLYRDQKVCLKPVMGQSNWLQTPETQEEERVRAPPPSRQISVPNYVSVQMEDQQPDMDKEQYEKLLYFQQQLNRQQEELTKMGVHVPWQGNQKI